MKATQQLLGLTRPKPRAVLAPREGYPHDQVEGKRWRLYATQRRKPLGGVYIAIPRLTMDRATPIQTKRNAQPSS